MDDYGLPLSDETPIRALRRRMGWSQAQMADFVGLSQSGVSEIEIGKRPESGPLSRLRAALEAGLSAGVVRPGDEPQAAANALVEALRNISQPHTHTPA